MKKAFILPLIVLFMLGMVSISFATLIEYEGGIVYDSHNDITWLKDAKYAMTSGYDSDGLMGWEQCMDWVEDFTYLGVAEWRLPKTVPGTDKFYQTDSEMGFIYYYLDNYAGYYGFHNPGPFLNLGAYNDVNSCWWSETKYKDDPNGAWAFNWFTGAQGAGYIGYQGFAWAVHDGNIGEQLGLNPVTNPVPEPSTCLLFLFGLIGILGVKWKFS